MIQNNFFSLERFGLLLKKELMENWKTRLLHFVTLYAVMAVLFCILCYSDCNSLMTFREGKIVPNGLRYFGPAVFLFWGFGCIMASMMFEKMQSKTKRISFLMTPATSFEKYLSSFLQVIVLYLIAFFVAFELADYTRVAIYSVSYPELQLHPSDLNQFVAQEGGIFHDWEQFWGGFSIFIFFQSLFILGSIIWYKKPLIKTIGAGVVLYVIFAVVDGTLIHSLFSNNMNGFFESMEYLDKTRKELFTWTNTTILFTCFTLFNWTIAYFRFKESEIINRI